MGVHDMEQLQEVIYRMMYETIIISLRGLNTLLSDAIWP